MVQGFCRPHQRSWGGAWGTFTSAPSISRWPENWLPPPPLQRDAACSEGPALRGLLFVTWVFPREDQRAAAFPREADPPSPFGPCTAEGPVVLPARVWSVKQGLRKAFQLLRCSTRQQQRADQASRAPTCWRCFGNAAPTPACSRICVVSPTAQEETTAPDAGGAPQPQGAGRQRVPS